MNNIEFIDYIKTQEAYQELLEQYNLNIIYIGGSRANGHTKPGSDWDLVAVTSDGCKGCKNISIINDRLLNVHIMIFSIQNFISMLTDSINYGNNMHLMQFFMSGYTAYKNFNLYNDGKLVDFFTFLEDNKQKITELCIIQLLRRMRLQLESIVINKNLNFDVKIYYNLLTAYDILNNTDSSLLIHKLR